jgi:hypothetical protein
MRRSITVHASCPAQVHKRVHELTLHPKVRTHFCDHYGQQHMHASGKKVATGCCLSPSKLSKHRVVHTSASASSGCGIEQMPLPSSFASSCTAASSSHVACEYTRTHDLSWLAESVMTPKVAVAGWCAMRRGCSLSGTVLCARARFGELPDNLLTETGDGGPVGAGASACAAASSCAGWSRLKRAHHRC